MRVSAVRQPHLRDDGGRRLLELCDVDRREGGGGQVVPVALRDEGPGLLLQLQERLQEELLLHRLLQQRDSAPTPRYDAAEIMPPCILCLVDFLLIC